MVFRFLDNILGSMDKAHQERERARLANESEEELQFELECIRIEFANLKEAGIAEVIGEEGNFLADSDSNPDKQYAVRYLQIPVKGGIQVLSSCSCPVGQREKICKHVMRVMAFRE